MDKIKISNDYFHLIKKSLDDSTELTFRIYFQIFLQNIAIDIDKRITIIHEAKKEEFGRPDFKIKKSEAKIGHIETKPINDNLDKYINTIQLKRYLEDIPNFVLTNYRTFILFRNGEEILRTTLFELEDKKLDFDNIEKVSQLIINFFNSPIEKIDSPEKLSSILARKTRRLKEYIREYWQISSETNFKRKLKGLYNLFKETLIEEITDSEFIDAYAQTISYGLFLARLNTIETLEKESAFLNIPQSLGVIKEIFELLKIDDIPDKISWIVDDIVDILNSINADGLMKLQKDMSFSKIIDYEDPYVYFYEHFLAQYDKTKRKSKGVYYTPIPVVHFIIEAIEKSLQEDFDKSGFDNDIMLLDFASGTGTFLLEAFKSALKYIDENAKIKFIKERLLKNFFGFEYLIAPYTIAHLKLTQFLQECGYTFDKKDANDRVGVYLTDTLDNAEHKINFLFPNISKEGEEANKIKLDYPILIIMGNPPYSNYAGKGKDFINDLLEDYKKGLEEKKINLDDEYIKFIRFAQWKIEKTGKGIIGIITNNSYLDGITHRIMRKNLLDTFDKIYILNLHGNTKKKEHDKNVFDIMVGVSIALFVKLEKPLKEKEIYYYSTLENNVMTRDDKYEFLFHNDIKTTNWTKLEPVKPYYWFVKKRLEFKDEYNKGWSLTKIFNVYGSGISTDRDKLFIDFNKEELENRIKILLSGDFDKDFIRKYNIKNSSSYPLLNRIEKNEFDSNNIKLIQYRPFDFRWLYYQIGLTSRHSFKVMQHFIKGENIGLGFSRIWDISTEWNATLLTKNIVDVHFIGGQSYIAPLYLYLENDKSLNNNNLFGELEEGKITNFTKDFKKYITNLYTFKPTPEEILAYIYATLHSPTYRKKYYEFLKIDFPKIIFTKDENKFKILSVLGLKLMELHRFKKNYPTNQLTKFKGEGNFIIEKIYYDEKHQWLYINDNQYFENVSNKIWEFEIGGYKVLNKYLKNRKNRELEYSEIYIIKKIINSISETIRIMKKIDENY